MMEKFAELDSSSKLYMASGALAVAAGSLLIAKAKKLPSTDVAHHFDWDEQTSHGGMLVGRVLREHGVDHIFTLCGGHISPILVGAKQEGIRVIDVRDEKNAAFAADSYARMTGNVGVAVVTAGPGVTNTVTAVKNSQLAQTPLIVMGGATADCLKGRGSLQDIDQISIMKSCVKHIKHISTVKEIVPALEEALYIARSGVPGPVFLEFPVDVLYPKHVLQELIDSKASSLSKTLVGKGILSYLKFYCWNIFKGLGNGIDIHFPLPPSIPIPSDRKINKLVRNIQNAERPLFIIGSQAMFDPTLGKDLQDAVLRLGIPTYLSSSSRGLLGKDPLRIRHQRRVALRECDLCILVGVQMDFRLDYGNAISNRAHLVTVNRCPVDLKKNRSPDLGILGDPAMFILELANKIDENTKENWIEWYDSLLQRDAVRNEEILAKRDLPVDKFVNPLYVVSEVEKILDEKSILIGDGGDFVGTTSYIVKPRGPSNWMDPGPFGTLGVGLGFAMAAKLAKPDHEVWVIFGDCSCAYSFLEFDTLRRHGIPVIAIIGNDACCTQIWRDQVRLLGDDVGCMLEFADYHEAAEGLGVKGFLIDSKEDVADVLAAAKEAYSEGYSVLINAKIGKTDFRDGSMSV
eukprot:TRINITY_DN2345_c0_g2_i1.p1 TRINITY_DN2345_c0_g2~~TRINITY_DN2345_c0_g2_i1.p1  ORF type:complete len:631 (-),score=146.41 TRINITY_DN2345_c0_g2_i1:47-1939(-)